MRLWFRTPLSAPMFHYVYCTENLLNNKIYVGRHTTDDMNDGYMGSGKLLRASIEKYGIENFKKHILIMCETSEEACEYETAIVDENFILDENTYNLRLGGGGGFDWINRSGIRKFHGHKHSESAKQRIRNRIVSVETRQKISQAMTPELRKQSSNRCRQTFKHLYKNPLPRTKEWKEKISKTLKMNLPKIAKFTHEEADVIRKRLMSGETVQNLAKELGVAYQVILRIQKNISYVRP